MWYEEAVFYQVFPLGFCDGLRDNDGVMNRCISEFADWIPHLQKLGTDAVYFSPIFESDFVRSILDFDQRFVISDWRGSKRLIELCMANERQLEQVTIGGPAADFDVLGEVSGCGASCLYRALRLSDKLARCGSRKAHAS